MKIKIKIKIYLFIKLTIFYVQIRKGKNLAEKTKMWEDKWPWEMWKTKADVYIY